MDKYLFQCLITCAVLVLAVGAGHPIGFSAVALPQLRSENSSMQIDDEMGSWIGKFISYIIIYILVPIYPPISASLHDSHFSRTSSESPSYHKHGSDF